MPFAQSQGSRIYWRLEGESRKPVLLLSHSLGCDHMMWQLVMPALLARFQVLRYDMRGHGASDVSVGTYTLALLAQDALAVADAAGVKQFHFCGLSLGGMTGMELAITKPERFISLTLANTSANIPPDVFAARIQALEKGGLAAVETAVMSRFFNDEYRQRIDELAEMNIESARRTLLSTNLQGYIACCAAIRDMQLMERIKAIKLHTQVIIGKRDIATPPEMGHLIATSISGAKAIEIDSAHLSAIEQPAHFAQVLIAHALGDVSVGSMSEAERLALGMQKRSAMLGDAYVQKSLAGANDFNREWQQFITQTAWGTVWTRGVLPDETRRLLVLVMTATGARWEEFRLHLRAALDAGMEETTLREALMQMAIYSGVPAANTAFHVAGELLAERQKSAKTTPNAQS